MKLVITPQAQLTMTTNRLSEPRSVLDTDRKIIGYSVQTPAGAFDLVTLDGRYVVRSYRTRSPVTGFARKHAPTLVPVEDTVVPVLCPKRGCNGGLRFTSTPSYQCERCKHLTTDAHAEGWERKQDLTHSHRIFHLRRGTRVAETLL
ncbi:hypothetical protein [Streptomyces lunaelactis]|uniref:hypothetical protein n=1 Tax=Streptomyces lunaelactis TaxID=1535768 RepID=UPI00131EFA0B|nr:hypothetical protein [Streptomyces lunaelactis]NUK26901.1 hypothetical protein [Streptomyces lunaelactis]NUK89768.1 hypothetical protein [Streptomyces lunaelactis]